MLGVLTAIFDMLSGVSRGHVPAVTGLSGDDQVGLSESLRAPVS